MNEDGANSTTGQFIECAQKQMAIVANHSCQSEEHKVSDGVALSTKNIHNFCSHRPMKIKAWWVGPYTIVKKGLLVAYGVDLPPRSRLHPVLHINELNQYIHS